MKTKNLLILFIIILTFNFGCNKTNFYPEHYSGIWNGEIFLQYQVLPFKFKIINTGKGLSAFLLNGDENVHIKSVEFENDSLTLFLPAFNTKLRLRKNGEDFLSGKLTLIKSGGIQQIMVIKASLSKKDVQSFTSSISVNGRWEVSFKDDENNNTIAVGEFKQDGNKLSGTFLTTTGDYRYLNGFIKGKDIQLSTFDGAHVFLFKAKLKDDGKLYGDFWSGTKWHETWIGKKNKHASLPNEDSLTYLKKGYSSIEFSLKDIKGKLVSLNDTKYKGKVVLVNLAGSWCPNCHDEARFLSDYYKKNKSKGLEIIALMFENYNDEKKNITQIERFKEKFDIKFDLLYAGQNDKGTAAKLLPMLNSVLAFPTTIYIDRKGQVRKITTGFSGPGTGKYFFRFQEKFNLFINKLLSE